MTYRKTLEDGSVGTVVMHDYKHGKRIFVDGNYRLSPKYGFLYYVEFDFNPLITNISNQAAQELGMIVKSVNLPKFTIDTKIHNAYNRKNIVQNKINYDPVSISFHDDQSDTVRNFWYDYYSYFYRDPDYADATYSANHKYQSRPSFDWGYSPRPAIGYNNANGAQPYQYIQAIRIYSMYQQQFSEYELINPIITSFKHGDHSASETTSMLSHDMTVQYEAVKYLTGSVTGDNVGGFITLNYDNTPSANIPQGQPTGASTNNPAITDLANSQTSVNPMMRMDIGLQSTALNPATGKAYSLQGLTNTMGAINVNNGGFSIPSLGSLTQGVTSGAMLTQQLKSAGVSLAGQAAGSLANGLTGALAQGLGPNGQSIVNLAAAMITNPKATLQTVENMAISAVMGYAINAAQTALAQGIGQIVGPNGLGGLLTQAGGWLNTTVSGAASDLGQAFNNASMGAGFVTNATLAEQFTNGTGPYAVNADGFTAAQLAE
jgi:hypothetical protein